MIAQIIQLAAELWQVAADDITGTTRLESVSEARTAVASVAVNRLGYSVGEVGRRLGQRHYSTIYTSCQRATAFSATSPAFRSRLEKLESAAKSALMASNPTMLSKNRQPDLHAVTARVAAALIGLQNSHPEVFKRLILAAFPEAAEMNNDQRSLPFRK